MNEKIGMFCQAVFAAGGTRITNIEDNRITVEVRHVTRDGLSAAMMCISGSWVHDHQQERKNLGVADLDIKPDGVNQLATLTYFVI